MQHDKATLHDFICTMIIYSGKIIKQTWNVGQAHFYRFHSLDLSEEYLIAFIWMFYHINVIGFHIKLNQLRHL